MRSADPRVQEYIRHQEKLRLELTEKVRHSEEFGEFSSDEQIWTNYELVEVFDQFAQFLCNRYPLNSTARKFGPHHTLNDVVVPVRPGVTPVKMMVDVLDEQRAVVRPYPFDVDPLVVSFPARLVPRRTYNDSDDFLRHFYGAERLMVSYTLVGDS